MQKKLTKKRKTKNCRNGIIDENTTIHVPTSDMKLE